MSLESATSLRTSSDDIRRRVSLWAALLKEDVEVLGSLEDISDPGIRERVSRGRRVRGWQTPSDGRIHVYLPGMAAVKDADNLFVHDVLPTRGLAALLGERGREQFLLDVWSRLYPDEKRSLLSVTGGSQTEREDWIEAADLYVGRAADRLADSSFDPEKAKRDWSYVMGSFFRTNGAVPRLLGMNQFEISALLSSGIRHMRREARRRVPELSRAELSRERDADFRKLEEDRYSLTDRDYRKVLRFGYPGKVYMSCYPKAQYHPIQLRLKALFGVGGEKQDRHPYSFERLRGLCGELDRPLAVFDSRDEDKPKTLVLLTRLKEGNRHFVVPVTPLKTKEGNWVNSIDSIYPKPDTMVLHWLVNSRHLVRYLDPSFEKEWLEPLRKQVDDYYKDALARTEAAGGKERTESKHLPNADDLAIRSMTARDVGEPGSLSRGIGTKVSNNLESANGGAEIVGRNTPGAIMDEYRMMLAEIESATRVVRSFVNPSLPKEDVRYFQDFSQKLEHTPSEKASVSIYNYLTDEEKVSSLAAEYRNDILSAVESGRTVPVHAPRLINGSPISDSGAVSLRLKMMARPEWTPYFLTRQQVHAMGLTALGEPTPVVYYSPSHGTYMRKVLYNLSDTDYPQRYPSTFDAIRSSFSVPPAKAAVSAEAVSEDLLKETAGAGAGLRGYLTRMTVYGACGESYEGRPDTEALLGEMRDLEDYGVYRLFESVGSRFKKACRENGLMPEKLQSLDDAIRLARGMEKKIDTSHKIKLS